jgi:hypothetical protein
MNDGHNFGHIEKVGDRDKLTSLQYKIIYKNDKAC